MEQTFFNLRLRLTEPSPFGSKDHDAIYAERRGNATRGLFIVLPTYAARRINELAAASSPTCLLSQRRGGKDPLLIRTCAFA